MTYDPAIPLSPQLGDANLDGFPDFLVIIASGKDRTPYLVYSQPCAPGVTGCNSNGSGRRGWSVASVGTKSLESVKDARGVTFLDMDEDVRNLYLLTSVVKRQLIRVDRAP
jgi:integrin alpha FG-GAP repeat containing protein 1